jgi:hypothetical protein
MYNKFIISLLVTFTSLQVKAVELEEPISVYVNDACQNQLLDYCNENPQLISFLTIYAENFEGYMQSEKKGEIKRMYSQYYVAELCIKDLYPKSNNEITATIKGSMLYSKERFSLFLKSERKVPENIILPPELPKGKITEYCNSLI